jgi:hypothetical protein
MYRLAALWMLSWAVVALVAAGVTAQVIRTPPRVVTGGDLGFRVDGKDLKGRPVGHHRHPGERRVGGGGRQHQERAGDDALGAISTLPSGLRVEPEDA